LLYLFLAFSFLLGLMVGSFLNVVIYRLPRGEGIVWGRSRCPACGETLRWYDLIPLLSYIWLRGRCRYCSGPISWRYPLVELLSGLLVLAVAYRFGPSFVALKYYFLLACLLVASFTDLEHYLIPNRLVLVMLVLSLPLGLLARDVDFRSALLGAGVTGGFLSFLALISPLGGGDVKLSAVVGLYLGWPWTFLGMFLGCFLAGVVGLILMALGIKRRKDFIPLGPFLALGFFLSLFYGKEIWAWYLRYLGF